MKTHIVPQGDGLYLAVAPTSPSSDSEPISQASAPGVPAAASPLYSLAKLAGAPLVNRAGVPLGKVADFLLDASRSYVASILFESEEAPGKQVSSRGLPMSGIREIDTNGHVVCDEHTVLYASDFGGQAKPKAAQEALPARSENLPGKLVLAGQDAARSTSGLPHLGASGGAQGTSLFHAIVGSEVLSEGGELLGNVLDVMVDVRHGRMAIAIVSYGGCGRVLGGMAAVPWAALVPHSNGSGWRLAGEVEALCQVSIEDYEEVNRLPVQRRIYRQFGGKDPVDGEPRSVVGGAEEQGPAQ